MAEIPLDEVDWRILAAMQADARRSFRGLAALVGMSAPAVAERVRRLEEAGVIVGYRAVVDPGKVGRPVAALIRLRPPGAPVARIAAAAAAMPEVLECHSLTGQHLCVLKVAVPSVAALEALIERLTAYGEPETELILSTPLPARPVRPPPG